MVKRKTNSGDDFEGDQSVPLPIQTFFWRQTSPFIRPKQGKLCEASCVSFERVVVQNILHGLSPSLCEAVQSVSRWKVVQAAFPHLMHACASLVAACKKGKQDNRFGPSETKLLYTLHWIILDAASECEDADAEFLAARDAKGGILHLHALSTVQLFVYLFAPLVHLMRDSDFESLKLENGLRLWQPLWEYQQPDIPCFSTPVKPQRCMLRAQRSQLKVNTNAANIYVGKGTSRENLMFLYDDSTSRQSVEEEIPPNAPLARMSDICTLSTADSQTATLEVICENCNTVMPVKSTEGGLTCRCGRRDTLVAFLPDSNNYAFLKLASSVDKDYVKQKLASAVTSGTRGPGTVDILSASYLDVAVMRCLFCLSWSEDGIYWALRYMHQRMLEVCREMENTDSKERTRSCSLPIPDLNVLMAPSKPSTPADPLSGPPTPTGLHPETRSPIRHVPGLEMRRPAMTGAGAFPLAELRKEPPFKKIRVAEIKQFFDSSKSFLRKKDAGDHDGKDDGGHEPEGELHRSTSAISSYKEGKEQDEKFSLFISSGSCRKSLPALSQQDKDSMGSSSQCSGQESSASSQADLHGRGHNVYSSERETIRRPIIRITEHSPDSKGIPGSNKSATSGSNMNLHAASSHDDELLYSSTLPRSFTDSNIAYKPETEVAEVSGSKYYIQENGHINYKVVLRAIHFVAMKEHAPRICEVLMNLLNCLLDLDIIESRDIMSPSTAGTPVSVTASGKLGPFNHSAASSVAGTPEGHEASHGPKSNAHDDSLAAGSKDEVTAHSLAMDSLFRIYKALGCPHGCGDGVVGLQGDHLRMKGQNCLQRLHKINPLLFHKFLRDTVKKRPLQETIDFLHAFLGFCFDPTTLVQSPMSQKKSVSQENIPRTGYANNFGHSVGGEGYRGVEGVLIANLVKPLITRCVECAGELYGNENILKSENIAGSSAVNRNNANAFGFGFDKGLLSLHTDISKVLQSPTIDENLSTVHKFCRTFEETNSLFCDVRQMMAYVKEIHGGTFRRVALSGLLDPMQKIRLENAERKREIMLKKQSSPIKRTTSVTSESGDEKESTPLSKNIGLQSSEDAMNRRKSKKSLFRSKITKYVASDSETLDEGPGKSPRTSISAAEEESPSSSTTPRRRFSKFNIGWRRGTKSDHEDDQNSDPPPLDKRESRSEMQVHRTVPATGAGRGRMSFRAASQATLTFLSARKRIEDGIKTLGKKMTRKGSCDDFFKQKSGLKNDGGVDLSMVREKKMVDKYLIKSGMLRFSFLLECCHPGSLPDPQLAAAMLDLEAPVSARAALLLECAHFIHRCNRGDWPNWMRLNLPSFRHTVAALQNRGQPSGYRRNLMLQRAAGRMFYSWAENLGLQMEYILAKEHADRLAVIDEVKDENRKKVLRAEDEEEDFLDEASVNQKGRECPYALKMLACLVLVEITTFLRETFQYLPRSRSQKREHLWEKNVTSRRYSSIVSSPGHSDKSSESNLAELPSGISNIGSPGDRKISFAVLTERSDSLHSSTTSLSQADPASQEEKKERGRRLAQGRQKLLRHFRRGSGHNLSFRRSFKLMRSEGGISFEDLDLDIPGIKHGGSIKSRKISSHSLQSDAKFMEEEMPTEDTESMAMMSDDTQESPSDKDNELEDEHLYTNLPWIKVVVQLANLSNFICTHQNYCHPNCYERQRRSCSRLTAALRKIYESTEEDEKDTSKQTDGKRDLLKEKLKRRESIFQVSSPSVRRRESTPLLEKIKTDVSLTKLKLSSTWKKDDKPKEAKEEPPIIKYLTSQAQRLTQCPMAILTKAAPVLNVEHFIDIMPVAWELMLESDQELAAAAASVFLLSSAKSSDKARNMIIKELQHEETSQRINAVLRFGALWKFRYQVWPRMEDGANMFFKLPPPSIDFTLPSPTIGLPNLTVIDPPWMPHFKTNIEEVTVNQEETKSLVTATTTRRKQQQEMIRKALLAEEERKRVGRENFPMTTVPITQLAAYEPALHHGEAEHEEVVQEELTLAARRVSLAPTNRANNQSRSMSWRNGSLHWGRLAAEGEEDRLEHGHHLQMAQSVFPSCICAAVLPVLHLLDDHDVNADGVSVAEVAYKVIWDCIVDDPILFLRHFLEKLTHKDRQEELIFLLRKLVLYFPRMPAQAAHSIFNYLIGYIMFYVRTPCEGGQDAIAGALSLLWLGIPSVEGIYFKDLKQTLKKEQCDPYLLVSVSVASAKKILVHGPDLSSIPSQLPIHEDTQFYQILQESLEFFNIPEDQHDSHFLVDTKTHQIHNNNAYVRDFYFFRRNFYPQLSLVHMNPDDAKLALQRRVFMLKFVEVGKVLLTNSVMESTPPHQVQNHVSFLHEELTKLPSFPRKALETEFDMYSGSWGKEIFGMDSLHKYTWAKLMSTMFTSMSSTFTASNDLNLFISVINGTIVLQFEDTAIFRFCLATLINASRHFKHIFATNGFLCIMPTLMRVYSNNQPNPVLRNAIHFVCKQFYILHRKPFILQMFGSVAPLLDMNCASGGVRDCTKVQPDSLFKLLLSLEKDCPDQLSVLDLVTGDKPLKALDFCYENDPDTFNLMDIVNMCVTVIAYAPDSFRSGQMLTVLQMVIPRYLDHMKRETTKRDNSAAARSEVTAITSLAVALRALITCCETFARSLSIPQRFLEVTSTSGTKPVHNHSIHSLTADEKEDSHTSRHMEEGRRKTYAQEPDDLELRDEFRKPRDSLLCMASEFYTKCFNRLKELRKIMADPAFRPPELYDNKTHNRLAEVAHTLLKLAPYDPLTMGCPGLQMYMLEILPNTDWSHELVRPGLNLILRRLDRLFTKISKKTALRRQLDWEAAANILKGVYQTLRKFSFIALLPHLKMLFSMIGSAVMGICFDSAIISTLMNILITILLTSSGSSSLLPESLTVPTSTHRTESYAMQTDASPLFVSSVVKLVAMQMQALGDQYSLEQICGGVSAFSANEKSLNLLINFILPLCIRVGSHCRDTPRMSQTDITFVLTVITNLLTPTTPTLFSQNSVAKSNYLTIGEQGRCGSISHADKAVGKLTSELHHHTALVGLEILTVCFDKQLAPQWHKVAKTIQALASKGKVDLPLWKFLDFLVTHRPSLFILLQTFIQFRMMRINCDTAQEYYLQQTIKDKLQGYTFSYPKSASAILVSLAVELRQLRDELASSSGAYRSRTATFATDQSDQSQTQIPERLPNATINEIAAEILGPNKTGQSLIKRSSRATLFSQSSSTASGQQRSQTQVPSSENSPAIHRTKSSKRITARAGSRILAKFSRKNTVDESLDMGPPHSPLLQRQFRGSISKQNSLETEGSLAQIVYENEDTEANGTAGMTSETSEALAHGDDPRGHRLQRQDAKSRKTFKIKRTKTKTSMRPRFMSHRRRPDFYEANDAGDNEDSPSHASVIFLDRSNAFHMRRTDGASSMARSVETIPESVEVKSARTRFLQRSKSHDEPSESPSRQRDKTAAMRMGRIHRQGGRIMHSRSPSVSPSVSPRPSFRRKKGSKDHAEREESARREDGHRRRMSGQNSLEPRAVSPIRSHHDSADLDSSKAITENILWQKLTLTDELKSKSAHRVLNSPEQTGQNSAGRQSGPAFQEGSKKHSDKESKSAADSSVSYSSPDTVVPSSFIARPVELLSPTKYDETGKNGASNQTSGSQLNTTYSDMFNLGFSGTSPETPTRRTAVRIPHGHLKKPGLVSLEKDKKPPFSDQKDNAPQLSLSALEQIKTYNSPVQSPNVNEVYGVKHSRNSRSTVDESRQKSPQDSNNYAVRDSKYTDFDRAKIDPFIIQSSQKPQYSSTTPALLSPTRLGQPQVSKFQHPGSTESHRQRDKAVISPQLSSPTQLSPMDSPEHKLFESGSSSPTSPSHITSFSSSPNDSPIRKPSFSSSQTSPTRKVSYSSSSTAESPTHKLFVSYRNSPSHRTGYISPQDTFGRKTSFSSSSHGSPVRKPSFSSSSDSKNKPTYSSTTSSQSSILSSPTHVPIKNYGTVSPDYSPTRPPFQPRIQLSSPNQSGRESAALPSKSGSVNQNRDPSRTSLITSPAHETLNISKYGRPSSPKMESSTVMPDRSSHSALSVSPMYSINVPKTPSSGDKSPQSSPGQLKGLDMSAQKSTVISQIPHPARGPSIPPKPTSLNLRDNMKESSTTPTTNIPPLTTKREPSKSRSPKAHKESGVQSLVSRFENKTGAGNGSSGRTSSSSRSGGPQCYNQLLDLPEDASPFDSKSVSSPPYTPLSPVNRYNYASPPQHTYSPSVPLQGSGYRSPSPSSQAIFSPFSPSGTSSSSSYQSDIQFSTSADARGQGDFSSHSYHSEKSEESPSHCSPSPISSSVYVARCDSSDSLSANESSSLLRDEDKSQSLSSLYYADEDIPDAV